MKGLNWSKWVAFSIVSLALAVPCDAPAQSGPARQKAPSTASTPNAASDVLDRGQHYKVLQRLRQTTNSLGEVTIKTNHYTVVANGLNFLDADGKWVESHPVVQSYSHGIACTGASYSVILSTNLNSAGAVDMETSDKKRIISNLLGLGFYDPDTGKSVMLAQVKDCAAVVMSNHIIFPDALKGSGIKASVEYVYDTGHFHQNITLLNNPTVQPSDFGMGSRTRLEILTEVLVSPEPTRITHILEREQNAVRRAAMVDPDVVDETLDFGEMAMGLGRAFPVGTAATNKPGMTVPKRLLKIGRRNILVESVPWEAASKELQKLQKPQQTASIDGSVRRPALQRELPEAWTADNGNSFTKRLAQLTESSTVKLALNTDPSILKPSNGFVLDYEMVVTCSDFDFYDEETYLVQGQLTLSGDTLFGDDVVIKYTDFGKLTIMDFLLNEGYTPQISSLVFTSINDDSVGDIIDGSTGSPLYDFTGAPALDLEYLNTDESIYTMDFRYCYGGLWVDNSPGRNVNIYSASFTDVSEGLSVGNVNNVHIGTVNVCNSWGMANASDYELANVTIGRFSDCHDTDHNGLPDDWEIQHFGHIGVNPNADPDHDGFSNLQEYLMGTDPNVPNTFFSTQPASQTVDEGGYAAFSVTTYGATPTSYQWLFNGVPVTDSPNVVSGSATANLALLKVAVNQAGSYSVRVYNSAGPVTSSTAQLTVTPRDPSIDRGVVLTGTQQDYTFRSDTTYLIRSTVQLNGVTTIEGGAIIKFDPTAASSLKVMGSLVCKTEPYHSAILTSSDDDSIGEPTYASTHQPNAAYNGVAYLDLSSATGCSVPALNLTASPTGSIGCLRFSYADIAIAAPATLDIWDCQVVECYYGVSAPHNGHVGLHNMFLGGCAAVVRGSATFTAEQITEYSVDFWDPTSSTPLAITLVNSIIISTLNSGPVLSQQNVTAFPTFDSTHPYYAYFQTGDKGEFYLATTSPCRTAGTVSISADMLAQLRHKTTSPGISEPIYTYVPGEMTLSPQVPRYGGGAPDQGYYYDPLDYTIAVLQLGGSIIVQPGTAIALRKDYFDAFGGFDLLAGSSLISQGTPTQPVEFTDVQFVQEGVFDPEIYPLNVLFGVDWWFSEDPSYDDPDYALGAPTMAFRFCNFHVLATDYIALGGFSEGGSTEGYEWTGDSAVYFGMRDCTVRGGRINLGSPDNGDVGTYDWQFPPGLVDWVDNLFERVDINLSPTYYYESGYVNIDMPFRGYNNTFHGGIFRFESFPTSQGNWLFRDNLFDKVAFEQFTSLPVDDDYDGFWPLTTSELESSTQSIRLGAGSAHDQVLTAAPPYQSSFYGNFYLPTTTPLYHAGSRSVADAGMFHYTTRTDQTKESDETPSGHAVSIGLHYVAANPATGLPKDTDGDGYPDWVEDANGNGVKDAGETDWQSPDPDPMILIQPVGQSAYLGDTVSFFVKAQGLTPLTYQWIHGGNVVGTQAVLTLHGVESTDAGSYYVIVNDVASSVQSATTVNLTVTIPPGGRTVTITSPANNATVSGIITVQAAAADGVNGTSEIGATLWVDGTLAATKQYNSAADFTFQPNSSFSLSLDTTSYANGPHQLIVKAFDGSGNENDAAVTVTFNNFIANCVASDEAFIPDTGQTVGFSADFAVSANWTLTVSSTVNPAAVKTFSGSGNQMTASWDGSGASYPGQYTWALVASPSGSTQGPSGGLATGTKRIRVLGSAPLNWRNINYHAYAGHYPSTALITIIGTIFDAFAPLDLIFFDIDTSIYTYNVRPWMTLLGYSGDHIPEFQVAQFFNYIPSDNLVYVLSQGIGDSQRRFPTMVFDGNTDPTTGYPSHFDGASVAGAVTTGREAGNPNTDGFMLVIMHSHDSASAIDARGNNDLASGFGIMNSPYTPRRAYVGWQGKLIVGPVGLGLFESTFWPEVQGGQRIDIATYDAWGSSGTGATPYIIGDSSLTLPDLFGQ